MKNLLRILMFVVIAVAVFFAGSFLIDQNDKYDLEEPTKVEETLNTEVSGDNEIIESGEEIFSGEVEAFSGEVMESGEISEVIEEPEEAISESGDEVIESGEIINN